MKRYFYIVSDKMPVKINIARRASIEKIEKIMGCKLIEISHAKYVELTDMIKENGAIYEKIPK